MTSARLQALAACTVAFACLLTACGGGGGSAPSPAGCTTVPAAPTNLAASSVTSSTALLSWAAQAPSQCTLGFDIYRDGTAIASTSGATTLKLTGLAPTTTYQITVTATDAAGASVSSTALPITTSAGGTIYSGITLTGKLIWHSYTSYGFQGVRSWMANFDTGTVSEITPPRLLGAMNYHFSPDGTMVVVMADDANITNSNGTTAWDLWVASVTDTGLSNLTRITAAALDGSRNEDPKFSSDGSKIIFKRNLTSIQSIDVAAITLDGTDQAPPQTTLLSSPTEVSMPFFVPGSTSSFLYADHATQAIYLDAGGTLTQLYAIGSHAYYPIAIDATHFYFAAGQSNDWVYQGDTSGTAATAAAFITTANSSSEFADPFPLGSGWLAFTSTAPPTSGGYDLWIGNFATGEAYPLDRWIAGSNHANDDLGPTFHGTVSH